MLYLDKAVAAARVQRVDGIVRWVHDLVDVPVSPPIPVPAEVTLFQARAAMPDRDDWLRA